MYRKLDCECKHEYVDHQYETNGTQCSVADCSCLDYDPAGHNPELINILCPQCQKARLEKYDYRTYVCILCKYVMFEKQILEILG